MQWTILYNVADNKNSVKNKKAQLLKQDIKLV